MARPRSENRRDAILAAAVRVIASQGLGAPTATIAREAGVANGSLFTYFATKADLLNALYVKLKVEMAETALDGVPGQGPTREQLRHVWAGWLAWATSDPDRRRTLAHLDVSDDVTPASRQAGGRAMADIATLLERCREGGPLREAPPAFTLALMSATADTTIDFMIRDPREALAHRDAGFDAVWRMIG